MITDLEYTVCYFDYSVGCIASIGTGHTFCQTWLLECNVKSYKQARLSTPSRETQAWQLWETGEWEAQSRMQQRPISIACQSLPQSTQSRMT